MNYINSNSHLNNNNNPTYPNIISNSYDKNYHSNEKTPYNNYNNNNSNYYNNPTFNPYGITFENEGEFRKQQKTKYREDLDYLMWLKKHLSSGIVCNHVESNR